MKKLSIIVPVYQVEQYFRQCVESIYMQDLSDEDFELILVNDGSRDNSFARIADIIGSHSNVVVVKQVNQGLSAARNTGLSHASGDYVLFLDSDDLLVPGSLAPLWRDASKGQYDMVVAGFVKQTDEEIARGEAVPSSPYHSEEGTGEEFFLSVFEPRECYVWRTIYLRSFLNTQNIRFVPGLYFEDVPFTVECYLKAGRCLHTTHTFYIYRQRPGSICSAISKRKVMDFNRVLEMLWKRWKTIDRSEAVMAQLMETMRITFNIEMWYLAHVKELYPYRQEVTADLKRRVPDLHFTGGFNPWLSTVLFRLSPSLYLWLDSYR